MRVLLLALALAADTADSADTGDTIDTGDTASPYDEDGDRFSVADGDCNDGDSRVYPGRDEECDGIDNNCDLRADEGCPEAPAGEGCDCGSRGAAWLLALLPAAWLGSRRPTRRSSSGARRSGTSPA